MFYYINNFLLFSIFGFFFETVTFALLGMHNQSGFMYLWWTPFYGTGVLISIISYKYFSKHIKDKKLKNILLFTFLFFILSVLEFTGGVTLEYLHGYSLWNYEHIPLHIGKYISVGTSLIWATGAFIYLYLIKKHSDKLVSKIPKFITIIVSIIFISDFILTMIKLIRLKMM